MRASPSHGRVPSLLTAGASATRTGFAAPPRGSGRNKSMNTSFRECSYAHLISTLTELSPEEPHANSRPTDSRRRVPRLKRILLRDNATIVPDSEWDAVSSARKSLDVTNEYRAIRLNNATLEATITRIIRNTNKIRKVPPARQQRPTRR